MANPKEKRVVKCPTCGGKREVVNGRWLAWVRNKAGMTMRDVAKKAKVSAPFINDIEHNKRSCTRKVRMVYAAAWRRVQQAAA